MEEKNEEKKTTTTKNVKSKNSTNTKKNTKSSSSANKSSNKSKGGTKNNQNKANTNVKKNTTKKKVDTIELLDKTNSFDIIIDDERLKDKESLDFSFIDGKRKKQKAREDIELLEEVDYKEEAKKIDMPKKEKKSNDFFSTMLIILFSFVLGFLICFIWARESDYFTETKKVIEEVVEEKIVVDDNYVFLGDSIFERYALEEFYKDMPVINSGVSGNKTIDILNNMNDRVYRYNPSKVILMIGTNDYSSISNEDTVKNIGKIIDGIKTNRPYAEIYVQSIYPVNKNVNDGVSVKERNNEDINTMNEGIKKLCKEKEVTYMNIYDLLIDEDGNLKESYTEDGLHVNDDAYEIITKEVMAIMKK